MATEVWTELVCANCSTSGPGQFTTGAVRRSDLKERAREAGWQFKSGLAYCGRGCLDEAAGQQQGGES